MNGREILTRLQQVTGVTDNTKLSIKLGLSRNAIGNWKSKGEVQFDKIIKYIDTHHKEINIHWLITGDGPMFANDFQERGEGEDRYAKAGRLLYEAMATLLPSQEMDVRSTVERILMSSPNCCGTGLDLTEEEYARLIELRQNTAKNQRLTDEHE